MEHQLAVYRLLVAGGRVTALFTTRCICAGHCTVLYCTVLYCTVLYSPHAAYVQDRRPRIAGVAKLRVIMTRSMELDKA